MLIPQELQLSQQDFPITMKGIITFSDYLESGLLINPTT